MNKYNCIVVGSGISALQLAKHLSEHFRVLMITKSTNRASNSYRAQGGIAVALSNDDESKLHYDDTLTAGCSFQDEKEVWELVHKAPEIIRELKIDGLKFDENNKGELVLGMEGAHSRRRIVHCGGDATGKHLMEHLYTAVESKVDSIENQFVYELIIHPVTKRCIGIKTKDEQGNNYTYFANHIVLASGGIGGLYSSTSNDSSIAGDGIALAYHVGAEIVDMEFIQFHPTLLYVKGETKGLISEAVRGEGARLVNENGKALMENKHPQGDLSPRHIVAKEIFESRLAGEDLFLDIAMIRNFKRKFPTITAICEKHEISVEDGKIPVAPGCHFLMGGVLVNSVGETSINGLYAIGETAAAGVHGANRLASNSLLEGLYYGRKVAHHLNGLEDKKIQSIQTNREVGNKEVLNLPNKKLIQEKMMTYGGIIRKQSELIQLDSWLSGYDLVGHGLDLDQYSVAEIQLLFMLRVAKLVTTGSLVRKESRGAHNRADFPVESERWGKVHIVHSQKGIEMRRKNECNQIEVHA